MSKIIRTQYDNTKCRTCGVGIEYGASVRWTKGVKGVVCMNCPDDAPASTTTPANSAHASDAQALRRRIGEQEAEIKRLNEVLVLARETFRQQRTEIATLTTERDGARVYLTKVTTERDMARAEIEALKVPTYAEAAFAQNLAMFSPKVEPVAACECIQDEPELLL